MNLLDLPPEVFQNVAHQLVSIAGINGAWKLHGVCGTLKTAITYEIFAKQTVKTFTLTGQRILEENWAVYIYYRSKVLLDAHSHLPDAVNYMIKYLVGELDVKSDYEKETLRQEPPPPEYLEKMVAAVCVGHDRLTVALMQELPAQVDHPIFGPPLQLATKLGHKAFVNAILDHMSTVLKGKKEPKCFLRANSSDSSSTSWINPATPCVTVERAILIALDKNNEDLLSLLVDWYKDQGFISCRSIYHEFMQTAVRRSGLAIVKAVLDDIPYAQRGMNSRVTWSDYETACMYGREDVVRIFFDQGYIIANDKVRAKSPLIVAVSSEQLSIVKVVVEAGADVNHKSTWNRGKVLPIMVAIRKQNVNIIHYLLDVGACLPTVTDWPTGQRFRSIYEILRQAKMKEGGV